MYERAIDVQQQAKQQQQQHKNMKKKKKKERQECVRLFVYVCVCLRAFVCAQCVKGIPLNIWKRDLCQCEATTTTSFHEYKLKSKNPKRCISIRIACRIYIASQLYAALTPFIHHVFAVRISFRMWIFRLSTDTHYKRPFIYILNWFDVMFFFKVTNWPRFAYFCFTFIFLSLIYCSKWGTINSPFLCLGNFNLCSFRCDALRCII